MGREVGTKVGEVGDKEGLMVGEDVGEILA